MAKRFPPGWDVNPSHWNERLPVLGVALLALCLPGSGSVDDFRLSVVLAASLLLNLFGGERRWIEYPFCVLAFGFITGPLLFLTGALSLIHMATFLTWDKFSVLRAVLALLMIGPAMDEVLATLQYVCRSLFSKGHREV